MTFGIRLSNIKQILMMGKDSYFMTIWQKIVAIASLARHWINLVSLSVQKPSAECRRLPHT